MKTSHATIAFAAAAVLAIAAPAFADMHAGGAADHDAVQGSAAGGANSATASEQDRTFVAEAASSNMMEVELGRLAASKASSPDVKRFGQHMSEDHGRATERLKSIASGKGMEMPAEMNAEHRAEVERLTGLSGAAFDKAYMDHMVAAHRKDVEKFRQQSEQGSDPLLRSFAEETLPKLRDHLASAQQIEAKTDASAAASE